MAFLTIVRRLRLYRFPQYQHSIPYQLLSPPSILCFFQAFHQTPLRQCYRNPQMQSGVLPRVHHTHILYQLIGFSDCKSAELELGEILKRINKAKDFASGDEALAFLDDSGVQPCENLISSVIWELRDAWKLAFLVFKWGEKWDCIVEKTWCLMIWLLGNHKKFSTAWTLIHDLYRSSKDTQRAMLIMIDRYVASNNPDKAIHTFHLLQKFKFSPEPTAYFTFLDILCRHGNIEEAEEFMFLNKKFFPLETKTFNIILNGWCNIVKDIYEAKRIWREMSNCCIEPDGISYTHMISCYSSTGNLFDSLRLYDQMKKRNWIPGEEVYHSLIYVVTREKCVDEALKIVDRMKELGMRPNAATYNLIICPLCEAGNFEEARTILDRMIGNGVSPTIDTFHLLIVDENLQGTLGVLDHMRRTGLGPSRDTFVVILDKLLKLGKYENALKIWSEMKDYKVKPDEEHYSIMVKGLAQCGLIGEAREFYCEMTSVGLVDDRSLKKLLQPQGVSARKGKGHMTSMRHLSKGKSRKCLNQWDRRA